MAQLTSAEIAVRLTGLKSGERLAMAESMLVRLEAGRFDPEACDALLGAIPPTDSAAFESALKGHPQSAACMYMYAKALMAAGRREEAASQWEKLLSLLPAADALLLLQYARLLVDLDRFEDAAVRVRQALATRPGYGFYPRLTSLLAAVWRHSPPVLRQARIAVVGSSTTSFLIPVLRALCFRDGIDATFYEAPFGAFRQEILDTTSGLYRFKPTVTVIMTHWRDVTLPAIATAEEAVVARTVSEYAALWRGLYDACPCHIIQFGFDMPDVESHGYLAQHQAGGRIRVINLINLALHDAAPDYVSIMDMLGVMTARQHGRWSDRTVWFVAKQHPALDAVPAVAEECVAHIRAITGLTRKVLVCDLDNTLWGGVIGEDGPDGIEIGSGSPAGEAFADLQRYLLELKQRGVLLAVCSKNNPDDARVAFEVRGMPLKLDDFAAFVANWNDKVENLRTIAKTLSLGTDSFVFLDDNPFERAWVRSQMPEVAVVELDDTPHRFVDALDRGRYFFSLTLSEEDRSRTELYRQNAGGEAMRGAFASVEEFLAQLQMHATVAEVSSANIARVTQLVNKTNQFNLTTTRHTQAEVEDLARRPGAWTRAFALADRFGNHGLIGVLLCAPDGEDAWTIDTWLMSCRVLGRRMELFMFECLINAARASAIRRVVGTYRPTRKNAQVANLYPSLGFRMIESTPELSRYELRIDDFVVPLPHYIREAATLS